MLPVARKGAISLCILAKCNVFQRRDFISVGSSQGLEVSPKQNPSEREEMSESA